MTDREWWRGAVIYQIYPRSFKDNGGDGVGDLPGIAAKLDYVASLGVDAVWLSPFFKSPMKDYGYDVSDYCDVDPLFGTLEDFRGLLKKAHGLGLKIIIDMVLSHTSDRHPWFEESRGGRNNQKSDWYVWADPKPDGSPPNNWQSHFGGPSWTYDVRRGQYYLHNFLAEQPDLNLYNKDVRAALFEAMRFWLDMGVDGVRLDAVGCYFHSPALEDNPPNPHATPMFFNINFPTPHSMQIHKHDYLIEPGVDFCKEIRTFLDGYKERVAVAEAGGEDGMARAARYTDGPSLLHTAYTFGLLSGDRASADTIADAVMGFERQPGQAWPSWAFSNHDVVRVASRWGGEYASDPRLAKNLLAVLLSLRGTIFLYQGEELGLTEAFIDFDQIQDPWGKYLYPLWQGRDGCRTPMPWTDENGAGFSEAKPWLPVPEEHREMGVATQEPDRNSTLHFSRAFMAWRKRQPALLEGAIAFHNAGAGPGVVAFTRRTEGQAVLCVFNMTPEVKAVGTKTFPALKGAESLFSFDELTGMAQGGDRLALPAFGFYFAEVS